jgi:hypothetical protein
MVPVEIFEDVPGLGVVRGVVRHVLQGAWSP